MVAARPLPRRVAAPTSWPRSPPRATSAGRSRASGVRYPAWEGTRTDTRIAYIADSGLRVVAGDGTGDHLLDRHAQDVPPAWDPARLHVLAYFTGGAIVLRQRGRPDRLARRRSSVLPTSARVVVRRARARGRLGAAHRRARRSNGRVRRTISMLGATFLQAAFRPGSHRLAVARPARGPQRGEARRRRPSGHVEAALRRAGRLPRPRLVAGRRLAARRLADGRTSGCSCTARTCRRSGTSASSSRAPTTSGRSSNWPAAGVAAANLDRVLEVGDRIPQRTVFLGPGRAADDARARRGRPEAARLLPLRLVVDLHERDGAPA